jgi:PadR family transcriptional regulator, phenolic acid-responsive transcriptional regulator
MSIKYAILGLLQYKDLHGYRIKQLIERDFGFMWTVNFGQIYPALKNLESEGLVTMRQVPQPNSPPRKLYSVTAKGKTEFSDWLASSPEKQMMLRDPFLLRFPFFAFGEPDRAIEIVQEQIDLYRKLQEQRADVRVQRGKANIYARQISELGIELNDAMLRWLESTKKRLEALESKKSEAI